MRTGFFANTKRGSKVHVIKDYNGPTICGSTLAKDMTFQHCAHGVMWEYIECERCKDIIRKMEKQKLETMKKGARK